MIRTASSKSMLVATVLAMGAAATGCNKSSSKQQQSSGDVGSVQLELRVPGVVVDVIHWAITKGTPPTPVKMGDHNVPQTGPSAAFLVTGLDAGMYTVTLSGNAAPNPNNPDPVTCSGFGNFTVTPGTTAHVNVILQCTAMPTQGGVAVDTTVQFEDCPFLTSYLVSSTQPGVGGTVDVTAAAGDRDATQPLHFKWSATASPGAPVGTFTDPNAATTQFACPAGFNGAQTLTIFVSNDVSKKPAECPLATQSILVLCVPVNCGDGVVQTALGEACDKGIDPVTGARLNGPGTGCSFSCTSDTCGNGVLDPGEACDDGVNNGPGKRCSIACTLTPVCGDGIKDAPETCDDGNTVSGDCCSSTCQVEVNVCGNGKIDMCGGVTEQCDTGLDPVCCNAGTCTSVVPVCGNGKVEPCGPNPEQCDDGNLIPNDGCEPDCTKTKTVCGDGIVQPGEECDDGNMVSLDGCSFPSCKKENACFLCREAKRGKPLPAGCSALMGCENLADATDQMLCNGLRTCLYANPTCWATNPSDCYCGTAMGTDCNTMPNGVCVTQAVAAAKVPPTDFTNGSIRYFNTNFPSGHATQEIVCDQKCITATPGLMCTAGPPSPPYP
jgi:cysteine-rich repeat protein